jgi:hypothetical protein
MVIAERAALPAGRVSPDEMSRFMALRRQEVIAEARGALGDRAAGLTDEVVLRTFYREMSQQNYATGAAQEVEIGVVSRNHHPV